MEDTDTTSSKSTTTTISDVNRRSSLVPRAWEKSVRTLGTAGCRAAALSLAHSFADDDLSLYLVVADDSAEDSTEDKWKLHLDLMTYVTVAHCLRGEVTAIGADYDSVALWMPPGSQMDDWWVTLRSGLWRLWFQLSPEGRRRYYSEFLPLLHDTKHEVMGERDEDCYYLVYIGTKPHARGKGYARKLIEEMAARADAENRAMYLESSSAANTAYYAKFGFQFKKDIFFRGENCAPVKLSIMVREPQSANFAGQTAVITMAPEVEGPEGPHRQVMLMGAASHVRLN